MLDLQCTIRAAWGRCYLTWRLAAEVVYAVGFLIKAILEIFL